MQKSFGKTSVNPARAKRLQMYGFVNKLRAARSMGADCSGIEATIRGFFKSRHSISADPSGRLDFSF